MKTTNVASYVASRIVRVAEENGWTVSMKNGVQQSSGAVCTLLLCTDERGQTYPFDVRKDDTIPSFLDRMERKVARASEGSSVRWLFYDLAAEFL